MENTNIEWCENTFNPWEGCTKVSPGCANCYAETRNARWNGGQAPNWGKGKPRRRTSPANWRKPIQWNKVAEGVAFMEENSTEKTPRPRIFCASLADWLDDEVPVEWLLDLLDLICRTPYLDWMLLSKRPENFTERIELALCHLHEQDYDDENWQDVQLIDTELAYMINEWTGGTPPENVWIGTSVEDQKRADLRIPQVMAIPAKIRFLSCEPLLESVDLGLTNDNYAPHDTRDMIHQVIVGGESGSGCREFQADWARHIKNQCTEADVAFFMKQMGGTKKPFPEIPEDIKIKEVPK